MHISERRTKALSAAGIASALNKKFSSIRGAVIFAVPPPPVQGLGTTGGFKLYIQDRAAHGYDELARVTAEVLSKARQQPQLNPYATYSTFQNSVPQLFADVDRVKAKQQGVPLSSVFDTLQAYLGSVYINDFNRFGRTYRVYAQAEARFRSKPEDIANLKTRNLNGDMVPMGAIADVRFEAGPDRVSHYNVYLASDINGQGAPGVSSGQATAAMERVLNETLPNGFGYEWTDLTFQQHGTAGLSNLRHAGVPDSFRAVRKLGPATGRDPDRADVPAERHGGRVAQALRQQRADADRLHRAGGTGVQERDPDRRIREGPA